MIDIHCHILPGIDDGARDITESAEMVNMARLNKIDAIIATPHFTDFNKIEDFLFNRHEAIQEFKGVLDSKVFTAGNLDELTLNGSRYMLCEYTLEPFNPEKAVVYAEEICARGYIPIIAHPERYISFAQNPTVVNRLWDMGCKFQVNASSLAGAGGEDMRRFTEDLILKGFADFIATDAHSHKIRSNRILDKIEYFPESITENMLKSLLEDAPLRVLKDEAFPEKEVEYF